MTDSKNQEHYNTIERFPKMAMEKLDKHQGFLPDCSTRVLYRHRIHLLSKLKNRVAAQTSRDRKKAKMDQMEHALQQLFSKNETLTAECEGLKLANQRLSQENADLYNRLQSPCSTCANYQNRTVVCETLNGPTESLLLPKGRVTHSAAILHKIRRLSQRALWKIVLSCLLCQTCSMNWIQILTLTHWNNLPRACYKTLPEIWKQLLKQRIVRNQKMLNTVHVKWWGRHQRNWNPVDVNS